jgi:hypothetical protein
MRSTISLQRKKEWLYVLTKVDSIGSFATPKKESFKNNLRKELALPNSKKGGNMPPFLFSQLAFALQKA